MRIKGQTDGGRTDIKPIAAFRNLTSAPRNFLFYCVESTQISENPNISRGNATHLWTVGQKAPSLRLTAILNCDVHTIIVPCALISTTPRCSVK